MTSPSLSSFRIISLLCRKERLCLRRDGVLLTFMVTAVTKRDGLNISAESDQLNIVTFAKASTYKLLVIQEVSVLAAPRTPKSPSAGCRTSEFDMPHPKQTPISTSSGVSPSTFSSFHFNNQYSKLWISHKRWRGMYLTVLSAAALVASAVSFLLATKPPPMVKHEQRAGVRDPWTSCMDWFRVFIAVYR